MSISLSRPGCHPADIAKLILFLASWTHRGVLTCCIIFLSHCFDEFHSYTRFTHLKYFKFDWFSMACLASARPSCLSLSLSSLYRSRAGLALDTGFRLTFDVSRGTPLQWLVRQDIIKYLWNSQLIKVIRLISQEYERIIDVDVSRATVVPRPGAASRWVRRFPRGMPTPNFWHSPDLTWWIYVLINA